MHFYLHFSFHQHDIQSFEFDHIQQHLLKADVAHFKIMYILLATGFKIRTHS